MESLLYLGFDNISSKNAKRIGKGFRQIEGLLAQICLSASQVPTKQALSASTSTGTKQSSAKQLDFLAEDLAFREFFRLQESFEWNVATKLIECLERLLGMGKNDQNDNLIAFALDLLQGILLFHPPSRSLFGRERNMTLLLDLLDPHSPPQILTVTLHVLVTALLSYPYNTRVFERTSGILTLTSLFKSRGASQELKLKVVEFFYFYLMHETPPLMASSSNDDASFSISVPSSGGGVALGNQANPNKAGLLARSISADTTATAGIPATHTKTTDEKQLLLGKYFTNVADLVQDLRENIPFATPIGIY